MKLTKQTGQVRKEHYAYEKNGSCAVLAAIELLTGKRLAQKSIGNAPSENMRFLSGSGTVVPGSNQNSTGAR